MEEKLFDLLKTKFSGEREDGLSLLACAIALQSNTEEDAIKTVEGLTAEKVKSYIKNWRTKTDSELTKANKTHEENLRKQFDFVKKNNSVENEDKNDNGEKKKDGEVDSIAKILEKALAPLQQKLEALEKGKTSESRMQALTEVLKEANPLFKEPALKSFSKMSFGSEEDFNNYIQEIKTDSDRFSQELRNQGLVNNGKPFYPSASNDKSASEAECDKIVENLNV